MTSELSQNDVNLSTSLNERSLDVLSKVDILPEVDVLFEEEVNRNTVLPLRYSKLYEAYQKQRACFWLPHEIDLSKDSIDWANLTKDEKHFIKMVLAFFASSDLIINENLSKCFSQEIKVLEAVTAYRFQATMEDIHSEMYSLLIDTYITDNNEKEYLFNAIKNIPVIAKLANWAKKWIGSSDSFAERLVAMSFVEGLFFSGPFCAIYWLKERGVMPGLTLSNDFISRDEGLHVDFAVLIHDELKHKCNTVRFHEIIKEALAISIEFITEALPCRLIGMNANLMKQHVQFVANRLTISYGYPEIYPNIEGAFTFMERICLPSKSNFFEKKPSQYSKTNHNVDSNEDDFANIGSTKSK
jgi:ribonucleotide reductase beta subunit family protein with ferritin-like domain